MKALAITVAILSIASLSHAAVLFETNFAAATDINDLVGNGAGQFDGWAYTTPTVVTGISPTAHVFDAANDKLSLISNGLSGSSGAGISRQYFNGVSNIKYDVVRFNLDLGFAYPIGVTEADPVQITFGVNYGAPYNNSTSFLRFNVDYGATGVVLENGAGTELSELAYGRYDLEFMCNGSTAAVNYTDPTGGTSTLDPGKIDIWLGSTKLAQWTADAPTNGMYGFGLRTNEYVYGEPLNLDIYKAGVYDVLDVPEPATMALLGFGGLAALLRRKR